MKQTVFDQSCHADPVSYHTYSQTACANYKTEISTTQISDVDAFKESPVFTLNSQIEAVPYTKRDGSRTKLPYHTVALRANDT